MYEDLIQKGNEILKEVDALSLFYADHGFFPVARVQFAYEELSKLIGNLPQFERPTSRTQLHELELRRRAMTDATGLEQWLRGYIPTSQEIFSLYGISDADLTNIREELDVTREEVIQLVDKLYLIEKSNSKIPVPTNNPSLVRKAEALLEEEGKKYHDVLGDLGEKLSSGFKNSVSIETTSEVRSQYHHGLHRVAFSIPTTTYFDRLGNVRLNLQEIVRIYAHEGLGHALNHYMSQKAEIPEFLKINSTLSEATQEAIALFMEQVVFDELRQSPELQRRLNIEDVFEDVYGKFKLSSRVRNYHAKTERYAIGVVADNSHGEPYDEKVVRKKIQLVREVALNPAYAEAAVINHTRSLSSSRRLPTELLKELMYCVPAVERALKEFKAVGTSYEGKDKEKINRIMLTGLWSPEGFVENARLAAQWK